jgi:hypothetical protein
MRLLQFFGRLCYIAGIVRTHLLSGSIVGTRRRLRTSPEGVAPATSGVLVQVFIVLHRFAFAHGFQCQCSGCIPVVFLCARPVTPQIRNGNAQRHNARLLIASSSLCAVASSVWLFRGILCTHPLPIHCPRPTDSLGRIQSSQQRVRCIIRRAAAATSTPNTNANRSTQHQREKHDRSLKHSTAQCTQTFRCQSDCSVFALHSRRMCSRARTAPHRTAPHRTAFSASNIDSNSNNTNSTPTSKTSRAPA